ncbi:MAG: hypothetical protein Q9207_008231, partial [Kuettlingeria erythrocarpa]
MNNGSPPARPTSGVAPLHLGADSPEASQLTAKALADVEVPEGVQISPSGKQAVYCLRPASRRGENAKSSLWLADIGKECSATQFTSGHFHDEKPQWSPDGTSVAFISDRAHHGRSSAIYLLPISSSQPIPITDPENQKTISMFKWSPNGQHIAFLSPDEDATRKGSKHSQKDDAIVYGAHWDYNRLRCANLQTRTTITLFEEAVHVNEFVWNAKSDQLIYASQRTPQFKNPALEHGVSFGRLSLDSKIETDSWTFPGPVSHLSWLGEYLYFLGAVVPDKNNSASMIYKVSQDGYRPAPFAYGANNCATGLRYGADFLAVQVQQGPMDQIILISDSKPSVLYGDSYAITTWDIRDTGDGQMVLLIGRGSPSKPTNLFSFQGQGLCQLSQHGDGIANLDIADSEILYAKARDNTELDGLLLKPKGAVEQPWPTIVLPHGGPLDRVTMAFNVPIFHWGPWLAAAGYAVLCPNYRGSSSRGENFASYGRGSVGTKDYSDIIDIIKSGIERNLFDPERIAIGGWSQGGFLSYLSVTRQEFHFKAAVCGGGITDWDMLVMSSDIPAAEAEMVGGAPWTMAANDLRSRRASAIWHIADGVSTKTPILILHSERDER